MFFMVFEVYMLDNYTLFLRCKNTFFQDKKQISQVNFYFKNIKINSNINKNEGTYSQTLLILL